MECVIPSNEIKERIEKGDYVTLVSCDACHRSIGLQIRIDEPPLGCQWLGYIQGKKAERVTRPWEDWCWDCMKEMDEHFEMKWKEPRVNWIHTKNQPYETCHFCKHLDGLLPCSRCGDTLVARGETFDVRKGREGLFSTALDVSGDKPICAKCWVDDPPLGTFREVDDDMERISQGIPIYDPYGTRWHLEDIDWPVWKGRMLELVKGKAAGSRWIIHV